MAFLQTKDKQAEKEIRETTPFIIVTNNIKYLGRTLTKKVKDLYDKNFKSPELVSLAAYVAEDGLVGHHWEEKTLGLANFICPSTGNTRAKKQELVGRGAGQGEGIGDFQDSI